MAFVVEDGTGIANANSLCSVEYADAYFADRGITDWAGTEQEKQTWLVRSTDYFETVYGQRVKGSVLYTHQALSFPRTGDEAVEGMPDKLLKGISEYALRAKAAALAPDPVVDPTGRNVVQKSTTAGPVGKSVTYEAGSSINTLKPYPAADMLIKPLLKSIGGCYR